MQPFIALASLAVAGYSYASPTPAGNYVPGQCTMHVTQYQKNENGVGGAYQFDVRIMDAIGALVGGVNRLSVIDFASASVSSELPYQVVISVGSVDSDEVRFAYAGAAFSSSSGCSTGGYEDGNRDMDCGFPC
ncbi:hypothetical protein F4777DRAFT_554623 [Nemania sp. FL0916]|nr:hypothetical protein F4777DRAFT_554623 [Nemania sp. FL0916]